MTEVFGVTGVVSYLPSLILIDSFVEFMCYICFELSQLLIAMSLSVSIFLSGHDYFRIYFNLQHQFLKLCVMFQLFMKFIYRIWSHFWHMIFYKLTAILFTKFQHIFNAINKIGSLHRMGPNSWDQGLWGHSTDEEVICSSSWKSDSCKCWLTVHDCRQSRSYLAFC